VYAWNITIGFLIVQLGKAAAVFYIKHFRSEAPFADCLDSPSPVGANEGKLSEELKRVAGKENEKRNET
jgi:hypothetical protein